VPSTVKTTAYGLTVSLSYALVISILKYLTVSSDPKVSLDGWKMTLSLVPLARDSSTETSAYGALVVETPIAAVLVPL